VNYLTAADRAWIKVVKRELISKVGCLDILFDNQQTSKLLTFKLWYLISHSALLSLFLQNLNLNELSTIDDRGSL